MHLQLRRDHQKIEMKLHAAAACIAHANPNNLATLETLTREYESLKPYAYLKSLTPTLSFERVVVQHAQQVFASLEEKIIAGLLHAEQWIGQATARDSARIKTLYRAVRNELPQPVLEELLAPKAIRSGEHKQLLQYRQELQTLFAEQHLPSSPFLHERFARVLAITQSLHAYTDQATKTIAYGLAVYVEDSALRMRRDLQQQLAYALTNYPALLGCGRESLRSREQTELHLVDCVAVEQQLNAIIRAARERAQPAVYQHEQLLLRCRSAKEQDRLARSLRSFGELYSFSLIPCLSLTTDVATANDLLQKPRRVFSGSAAAVYRARTYHVSPCYAPAIESEWNLTLVDAEGAWHKTRGTGSTVAVIDTGIDYRHAELASRFSSVTGVSFVSEDCDDDNGHGTHVAGTVAGERTGVAPGCSLYAVKVLDSNGVGSEASVLQGIEWAIQQNVHVINMSLGSAYGSDAEADLIAIAAKRGIAVCCAAGNDGDSRYNYPASHAGAISVAAVNKYRSRAPFSNYNDAVDLAAPGVSILSTWPGGGYETLSGTSMATPHVAGACALLASCGKSPETTLKKTADNLGEQEYYGAGLIQCGRAVQ